MLNFTQMSTLGLLSCFFRERKKTHQQVVYGVSRAPLPKPARETAGPALTAQAGHAGRGLRPGGQGAAVGRGAAEEDVVGQRLVQS